MPERGRSTKVTDTKSLSRSRSRVRMSLKKIMKGIGRNSTKSMGDNASLPSLPTAATSYVEQKISSTSSEDISSLQLVLLLLDPATRRFELLQLEFDSTRARVADIIAQIPVSVTEDAIKNQQYYGVLGEAQEVKGMDAQLVDFCKEKQVLVALPKGLPMNDCMRLARPILNDEQVLSMLSKGGFDLSTWMKSKASSQRSHVTSPRRPAEASPRSTVTSASRDLSAVSATRKQKRNNAGGNFTVFAILIILAIVIQAVNKHAMTPIQVGVLLAPGATRSRCGLLGYLPAPLKEKLPSWCANSFLEVSHHGTVSVIDENGAMVLLKGHVCSSKDCIDGVMMHENGSVFIGGKRVKSLTMHGKMDLTPFPFEVAPKLKVKMYKK